MLPGTCLWTAAKRHMADKQPASAQDAVPPGAEPLPSPLLLLQALPEPALTQHTSNCTQCCEADPVAAPASGCPHFEVAC